MNLLIVEDESHTAALLKEIIEQDKGFIVTETLESVEETVQYLSRYQSNLDLLFFDIQLADGQSFEIFKHIDVVTPVVFCTAFEEYPLQAIKSNGIDYVLKPFKEEEIHNALIKYKQLSAKLKTQPSSPINFQTPATPPFQRSFLTQYRKKTLVKRVEEIALFSVEHENVFLYVFKGEKFPLFKKLDYIDSVCDPAQFFRINRQLLINRDAIISFEPYFNRKIILQLKTDIKTKPVVSRLKVTAFKEWLEQ